MQTVLGSSKPVCRRKTPSLSCAPVKHQQGAGCSICLGKDTEKTKLNGSGGFTLCVEKMGKAATFFLGNRAVFKEEEYRPVCPNCGSTEKRGIIISMEDIKQIESLISFP